jgi:hypothetical protein
MRLERVLVRTSKATIRFSSLIAVLALIAAGAGLFWHDGDGMFSFTPLRREATASPAAAGVKSFVSVEKRVARPGNLRLNAYQGYTGDEEIRSGTKRWYQAPNQWRTEEAVRQSMLRASSCPASPGAGSA